MGIKNLNNLLRKKCPHVFVETHLSEYAFKKLAVDVSLFMCKFKAIRIKFRYLHNDVMSW